MARKGERGIDKPLGMSATSYARYVLLVLLFVYGESRTKRRDPKRVNSVPFLLLAAIQIQKATQISGICVHMNEIIYTWQSFWVARGVFVSDFS